MSKLKISDVARSAGVSRDTVRKCERLGLITAARDRNGWRWFDPEAVRTIRNEYQRVQESNHEAKTG